jgi:hypothetical protein
MKMSRYSEAVLRPFDHKVLPEYLACQCFECLESPVLDVVKDLTGMTSGGFVVGCNECGILAIGDTRVEALLRWNDQ